MRFLKSFKYAFRGIIYCINNERNMRVHTVAALYVLAFSFFFGLSRLQYAALIIIIGVMLMAEMFNTVAERICDMTAANFQPIVRIIKDVAAGAVLVCAFAAVGVALCFFWKPAAWLQIWYWFLARPYMFAVFAAVTVLSLVYIIAGPLKIRDFLHRKRAKYKENT